MIARLFGTNNKKVKVFGERNSGTIYLEKLLVKNFKVDIADYFTLGWKHRLAPHKEELDKIEDDIIYLILVKNPYAWLRSMHRKPYHQEQLKQLSFNQFIEFPYGDYENPVKMWNAKYRAYLHMNEYAKNFALIKYEELLETPEEILSGLKEKFNLKTTLYWFSDIQHQLTNNHGELKKKFHKNYYLKEKWKSEYKPETIALVNKYIDNDLMQQFDYKILQNEKELIEN
ncbi:MAG TPA: hypothetical protein DIU39_00720 [Flavobacteriales bacterium]|nr:hypothetical protein [Flavobacteriales bacterium]|tara:strand:+ start:108442 stop:109128 length:687 start_codon:yes stop_codon:yes gene_type:complete